MRLLVAEPAAGVGAMMQGRPSRTSLGAAIVGVLLGGLLPTAGGAAAADEPETCVDGYRLVAPTRIIVPEDVRAVSSDRAVVAGGALVAGGHRAAHIARYDENGWHRGSTKALGNDAGYVALDGTRPMAAWAVGYVMTHASLAPLVVRQGRGGSWRRISVPRPGRGGSTLTDVSSRHQGSAWAVGYSVASPGARRPYVLRWDGKRWHTSSPGLKASEQGMLAGVSSSRRAGTWVVGTLTRGGLDRPYMARRLSGRWKRIDLSAAGAGSLAAITMTSGTEGWAVGHRIGTKGLTALVLRRTADGWQVTTPPAPDSTTILVDVSVDAAGTVTVSGSTWLPSARRMRAFVATWDGSGWIERRLGVLSRHAVISAVDGDPAADGWAVGGMSNIGVVAKTCAPSGLAPARKRKVRTRRRVEARAAERGAVAAAPHISEPVPPARPGLERVPQVRISATAAVRMRDRARAAGLPTRANTYGAVIEDFDGDGREDIFLGRHTGPATLYLDAGATYVDAGVSFGRGDRHGCAAADVDGSGLPDLYCSFGGGRGLGMKANQLWLDPGGPDPRLEPVVGGAPEPLGRGRETVFLDVDGDGRKDLFLGQQPNRVDGLSSTDRLYRRDGPAQFVPVPGAASGFGLGSGSLDSADIDGDGRSDLVLVFDDPKTAGVTNGIRLFRGTSSGLRNVTRRSGVRTIGEIDAELVRLDGDRRPDLVQLSQERIRVSLRRDGRYRKVYERRISHAVAVAAGDADGDGDQDLYILRQKDRASIRDIVLFNRGNGRSFRAVAAPSRKGGRADDVFPIDHDQNGLTDFLVLNGSATQGPVQLVAFYRR